MTLFLFQQLHLWRLQGEPERYSNSNGGCISPSVASCYEPVGSPSRWSYVSNLPWLQNLRVFLETEITHST